MGTPVRRYLGEVGDVGSTKTQDEESQIRLRREVEDSLFLKPVRLVSVETVDSVSSWPRLHREVKGPLDT